MDQLLFFITITIRENAEISKKKPDLLFILLNEMKFCKISNISIGQKNYAEKREYL